MIGLPSIDNGVQRTAAADAPIRRFATREQP